jgi:large subunit ribosomal protein L17
MRHHNKIRKFGRVRKQRTALMRSLAIALITHGKIQTTESKAKELRPLVEKLITKARTDSLFSRRFAGKMLGGRNVSAVSKLFTGIAPGYAERKGGYTRILKLSPRKSDGSKMAVIELIK